jgi:hypothetical protein
VDTGNGRPPPPRLFGSGVSRRVRLLIGGVAALVIAMVLVAPVVLLSGGGTGNVKPCSQFLRYQRRQYVARLVTPTGVVDGIAIGVGAVSGCGVPASDVNVRSLLGIKPTAGVELAGEQSSIYVRRGVCSGSSPHELLGCLSRSR